MAYGLSNGHVTDDVTIIIIVVVVIEILDAGPSSSISR